MKKIFSLLCCSVFVSSAQHASLLHPQETARQELLTTLSGEWVSRSLYVATKLGIADFLEEGPLSAVQLAEKSSSHPESLKRLLHLLSSHGIFEEISEGVFINTEASRLLIASHPNSLHSLAIFYGEDIHRSFDNLLGSVQTGTTTFELAFNQPVFSYFRSHPVNAALFQDAMKEKSRAVALSVLSAYDFSRFSQIYDIGGGVGQFLSAILTKSPHATGVLFELPEVIEKVKPMDRCSLTTGDFFTSVPTGGDVYLLKSILHDWDDAKAKEILRRCYEAMGPESKLLIIEVVLQPKSLSLFANAMDLLMLAVTGGKERTAASFTRLLQESGFELEAIYPTTTEFSILEAKKL